MDNLNKQWVGSGVSYPDMFDKVSKSTKVSTEIDRINQSIHMILSTPKGTRFFMPDFGSQLYEDVFEPNDFILQDMIELHVTEALEIWEPRITVTEVIVDIESHDNEVPVTIYYKLANSNITNNYVYPFQRNAMDID